MSVYQCEALTLRTYPYSESHQIVVFLTREHGKVRAMAYGAKKTAKRGFGSAFEPLTHLRLSFSRKGGQELATVKDCEILRAFPAFRLSWESNLHFGYFSELLLEVSREGEEADHLFRLMLAILGAIEKVPAGFLARYLELWILHLEGVLPRLESRLPRGLADKALDLMKMHPETLDPADFSPEELNRLEKLSCELLEHHLEKQLTTKRMLKELL